VGRKKEVESKPVELLPNRKAIDPEAREKQMINLAINCAEKQMREGTASSQVICHYLKLGSIEKSLELEKLRNENKLLKAKTEALEQATEASTSYKEVIDAIKLYSGHADDETIV